ncbi:MAG: sulfotransferase, partial [Acidimicrobiales bacterium]
MTWAPPARPVWVERLIAHGDAVGGPEHLVGLDADELVATAVDSTGLDDFGPPTWRPHYDVLLKALEQESDLHLVGRLMARTEILRSLRNRLELQDLWS